MYRLDEKSSNFLLEFDAFLNHKRDEEIDVTDVVRDIVSEVRRDGDVALRRLTKKFDRFDLDELTFSREEIETAIEDISPEEREALELAADRIYAYHKHQRPADGNFVDDTGARLGWHFSPIKRAGIYVPGGTASYPSSVLMNAIPAKVAGVQVINMCVPTPDGVINPLVLYAAELAGVNKIFKIGGAQAIAALAYGTETIRKVDKITGPGNAYVAEAKRQVFGRVGIDMIAGPSEVLVIADKNNNPDWIAVDLLSQAEHDQDAQAILITDDAEFGEDVIAAVVARLKTLERGDIARKSWEAHGAVIVSKTLQTAAHLSNLIAPEHLQICTKDARALSHLTTEAGAIFLGEWTPEAIGDYVGGPNHVLPTSGTARFASGLGVLDFMKRTTLSELTPQSMASIGPAAFILATSEGLQAHGLSVQIRLDQLADKTHNRK